jgi:hypothetical protein
MKRKDKITATLEEIWAINTLTHWIDFFKWQGGTIWQVKAKIEEILNLT